MAERLARIQLLIDTTENWQAANPILLNGEIGLEIKTGGEIAFKVGNGTTAWNSLEYAVFTPSEVVAMRDELQDQIDNIVIAASEGGDSSIEVAQSRVNASGVTYATLKARLDAMDAETDVLRSDLREQYSDGYTEFEINYSVGDISSSGAEIDSTVYQRSGYIELSNLSNARLCVNHTPKVYLYIYDANHTYKTRAVYTADTILPVYSGDYVYVRFVEFVNSDSRVFVKSENQKKIETIDGICENISSIENDLSATNIVRHIDFSTASSGYVNSAGTLKETNSYFHTEPFEVEEGTRIIVNAAGYLDTVAIISKHKNGTYTPVVLSDGNTVKEYEYISDEKTEIVVSYFVTPSHTGKYYPISKETKEAPYEHISTTVSYGLYSKNSNKVITDYGYQHTSLDVSTGDTYAVSGIYINSDFRLWIFVDSNGVVKSYSKNGDDTVFTATENGILYVNGDVNRGHEPSIYTTVKVDSFEYSDMFFATKKEIDEIKSLDGNFEIDNIHRRILNLEHSNDFAWADFDKPYFVFVVDDTNEYLEGYAEVFATAEVPLGCATIISRLTDTHLATLRNVVANGGEVLAHYSGSPTDSTSDETWLTYTRDVKKTLESKGFNVRGIIRADSTAKKSTKGEKYCRLYFDYANDQMGKSTQYNLPRILMGNFSSLSAFKAQIDADAQVNGIHGYGFHGLGQTGEEWITNENMAEIISYIKSKGNCVITTYSYLFDRFGSSVLAERIKALEN